MSPVRGARTLPNSSKTAPMTLTTNSPLPKGMGMSIVDQSDYDWDYWNGRLLCWEEPRPGFEYALGVDPAEGVGADRSVCQVLRKGTVDHPDIQVAEFACDFLDPVDFASVVKAIGDFYADPDGTEAFATIECNAPCGDTMINDLRMRLNYSNLYIWKAYDKINNIFTNKLGWWTNRTTRPKLIARGLHAFANGDLRINSPFLLDEMEDFERDHFIAKAKARVGRHDDRIMSILIAYWGAHDDEWMAGEDIAEDRRLKRAGARYVEQLQSLPTATEPPSAPSRRADYQNRPLTYAQMMAEADASLFNE